MRTFRCIDVSFRHSIHCVRARYIVRIVPDPEDPDNDNKSESEWLRFIKAELLVVVLGFSYTDPHPVPVV